MWIRALYELFSVAFGLLSGVIAYSFYVKSGQSPNTSSILFFLVYLAASTGISSQKNRFFQWLCGTVYEGQHKWTEIDISDRKELVTLLRSGEHHRTEICSRCFRVRQTYELFGAIRYLSADVDDLNLALE